MKQIGRDLNVRYALEGSVQRGGNRMRVNVQLIDAETGLHLWAERFDKSVGDLFDMQDEIVARLANQSKAELISQEARRAAKAANPDSMDFYFQGMARFAKGLTPPNIAEARRHFECAIAADPEHIDALAMLALCVQITANVFGHRGRAEILASAETMWQKALAIAPNHALSHYGLGVLYVWTNRAAQELDELEHAVRLDRNLADSQSLIGVAKLFTARAEKNEAHQLEALRLSPQDNQRYVWMFHAGAGKLLLGGYESAVAWIRRSIEANRNFPLAHVYLRARLPIWAASARRAPRWRRAWRSIPPEPFDVNVSGSRPKARSLSRNSNMRSTACACRNAGRMSAERKIAAILAADIAGYSRLAGRRGADQGSNGAIEVEQVIERAEFLTTLPEFLLAEEREEPRFTNKSLPRDGALHGNVVRRVGPLVRDKSWRTG